jgi:hypothetical protein
MVLPAERFSLLSELVHFIMNFTPPTASGETTPTTERMSTEEAISASRYPKRKREPISYQESEMDSDTSADSEVELLPAKVGVVSVLAPADSTSYSLVENSDRQKLSSAAKA